MDALLDFATDTLIWLAPPTPTLTKFKTGPPGKQPLMFQFFEWESIGTPERSWWVHFKEEVPKLAGMGVTIVWLPPPNRAAKKTGQGYDAYDLWDLGEFTRRGTKPTRWGTKEELVEAIRVAAEHGIDVLIDAVTNHKLGADSKEAVRAVEVHAQNRNRVIGPEKVIEAWTKYDFSERGGKYSTMKWRAEHFTGTDWDAKVRKKGVFRFCEPVHQGWNPRVDRELGNYDYLLGADIDHRHPEVHEDFMKWGPWVLETTGGAGFRLDAIKHMDRQFLTDWLRHTRATIGKPDAFAVAEYWEPSAKNLLRKAYYFGGETTFFDVPLHSTFHKASNAGSAFDLRTIFNNSFAALRPDDAVTFVDNHDTVKGQSLESWVGPNFKLIAYAFILLHGAGLPCVFYKDIYDAEVPEISDKIKTLLKIRQHFAYGKSAVNFSQRNCVGWVCPGDEGHPDGCAVLVSNGRPKNKYSITMQLPNMKAGTALVDAFAPSRQVSLDANSRATFTCYGKTVSVWVRADLATRVLS